MIAAAETSLEVARGVHADIPTADDKDPRAHNAIVRMGAGIGDGDWRRIVLRG